MTSNGAPIRVADAFPEVVGDLDAERSELARRHALAMLDALEAGRWQPPMEVQDQPGHLGLLVVEGLLTRDVVLGGATATEIVGRGDILRPADHDGESAPVPFGVEWTVLESTRVAVLDRRFALEFGHCPEMLEALMRRAIRRVHSLALHLAVSHLRRVDTRLLVLLWHLADRWGRVEPNGVRVPVRLTHQTLGRLVGAQRPSVTTALKQLAGAGHVARMDDGTWLLCGEPPDTLERIRATVTA